MNERIENRVCSICDTPFTVDLCGHGQYRRKYCSDECRKVGTMRYYSDYRKAKKNDPVFLASEAARWDRWKKNNPEKHAAQLAKARAGYQTRKHTDAFKDYYRRARVEDNMRAAKDAGYAEFRRARMRVWDKMFRDRTRRKPYVPKPSCRIPAEYPFGVNPIDRRTVYVQNNMDWNQRRACEDFAMRRAIEKRLGGWNTI